VREREKGGGGHGEREGERGLPYKEIKNLSGLNQENGL